MFVRTPYSIIEEVFGLSQTNKWRTLFTSPKRFMTKVDTTFEGTDIGKACMV